MGRRGRPLGRLAGPRGGGGWRGCSRPFRAWAAARRPWRGEGRATARRPPRPPPAAPHPARGGRKAVEVGLAMRAGACAAPFLTPQSGRRRRQGRKKKHPPRFPPPPRGGRTPPPLTPLFPSSPVPHAGPTHNTPRPVPAAACNTMGVDDEHGPAVGDDFVYSSGLTSAGEGERGGEAEGARGCRKARETPRRFLFFSSSASPSHLTPRRRPTSPIPHPPPPPTHRGRAPAGGARPQ